MTKQTRIVTNDFLEIRVEIGIILERKITFEKNIKSPNFAPPNPINDRNIIKQNFIFFQTCRKLIVVLKN
jgi:hypothetical protein